MMLDNREKKLIACLEGAEVKRVFREKFAFPLKACLLWGFAAHGMAFFNKYSTHDDAYLFDLCGTYSSGRWMLGELGALYTKVFGSWYHSTPLFNGIVSVLAIALLCALILDMFSIRSRLLAAAFCGVAVTFPTVTGTFGFMFTAPYYMLGAALGVAGVFVLDRSMTWSAFGLGSLLGAAAVGVYQANLPICVCLLLMCLIKRMLETERFSRSKAGGYLLYYACACAAILGLYLLLNRLELSLHKTTLTDYQNISSFGVTDLKGYWERIRTAYREFFFPTPNVSYCMFPIYTKRYYKLSVLAAILLSLAALVRQYRRDKGSCVLAAALMLLIPMACNLIFVMCGETVYTMMMYGECFFFVYFAWMADRLCLGENGRENAGAAAPDPGARERRRRLLERGVKAAAGMLLLLIGLLYCRFANICYLRAEFEQQQTISYYTTLISRISSTEGYDDAYPIVYINEFNKKPTTGLGCPDEEIIYITPYKNGYSVNVGTWRRVMKNWCGYDPETLDEALFAQRPEVMEMPCYPDSGSIKVIDGAVVVKFSETAHGE